MYPPSGRPRPTLLKTATEHIVQTSANGLGGKDGTLVVNKSKFKNIQVAEDSSAVIQSGNRLGDVVRVLSENGCAMPYGTCPFVGTGGRMSCVHLARHVLDLLLTTRFRLRRLRFHLPAVGPRHGYHRLCGSHPRERHSRHRVRERERGPFWALNGAAPPFGLVTAWHSHTYEIPQNATVFTDTYDLSVEEAVDMVNAFTAFTFSGLHPTFGSELTITKGTKNGRVTIAHVGALYADSEKLKQTFSGFTDNVPEPISVVRSPIESLTHPNFSMISLSLCAGSYVHTVLNLGGVDSLDVLKPDSNDTFYTKSLVIPEARLMTDDALTAWFGYNVNEGSDCELEWFLQIQMYGGNGSAINQIDTDATAYAHRSSLYTYQLTTRRAEPNHAPLVSFLPSDMV